MTWRVKALVQRTLGILPYGDRVHSLLQRTCGGLGNFAGECDGKIDDWMIMAGHLQRSGLELRGARFLEIGTGWYPTLPICTYLAGARSVFTLDLNRYLEADLTLQCARRVGAHLDAIARIGGRPLDQVSSDHDFLVQTLGASGDLLAASRGAIRYQAPADAARTRMEPGSVDVVFSNSVLEHVPRDVIEALTREAYRILRPGGLMFHSVNCGDHYSYFDRSITQLNYLQFSDRQWKPWNNAFLYQNRLRAVDFTAIATAHGFEIVLDTAHPTEQRRRELENIPVAECFRHYTPDQLCITTIDFIGRRPGPDAPCQ